jgi:hypothetical protein
MFLVDDACRQEGKAFCLLILLCCATVGLRRGATGGSPASLYRRGLEYEVGFGLIGPVGGKQRIPKPGNGRYRVTMRRGLVDGSGHRKEIYRSTMTTINNGKRLIPLKFEEYSVIGEWYRKRTTTYNYPARKVIVEGEKEGKPMKREEMEIPVGVLYDDPVTAFYNLRFEVYGKVEPGREFILRTIPSKGQEIIRIQVAKKEEAEKAREAEKVKTGKDLLIRILLDREMWGRKKGELEIWFNRDLLPISGVVKDIPIFGNERPADRHGFSPSSPEVLTSAKARHLRIGDILGGITYPSAPLRSFLSSRWNLR